MLDDPLWVILLRWSVLLLIFLACGMAVVLAEGAMLDRIARAWSGHPYRRRIRRHRARRATFTTTFES
jgi:hypothetical protein